VQSADAGTLRGEDGDNLASAKSGSLAQAFGDRLAEARALRRQHSRRRSPREDKPRQVPTAQAYSASLTKSDRFPADHMKSSVARTIPLSGAARALLDSIRLLEMKQSTLIFGSCRRSGSGRQTDGAMQMLIRKKMARQNRRLWLGCQTTGDSGCCTFALIAAHIRRR
jgi:integrase